MDWKVATESKPKQGERVLLKIMYENCPVVGYWGAGEWEACTVNIYSVDGAYLEGNFEQYQVTHYAHITNIPKDS